MKLDNYLLRVKFERKAIEIINEKEISIYNLEGLNLEAINKWGLGIQNEVFFKNELLNLLYIISKKFGYAKDISMPKNNTELDEKNSIIELRKIEKILKEFSI